jgi:hypothetical protein
MRESTERVGEFIVIGSPSPKRFYLLRYANRLIIDLTANEFVPLVELRQISRYQSLAYSAAFLAASPAPVFLPPDPLCNSSGDNIRNICRVARHRSLDRFDLIATEERSRFGC